MRSGKNISARIKSLFKSKFFIILLAVAVFLTVLPVTLGAMGRSDIVRSGANIIATPFRELARVTGSAIKGFADYFAEIDKLRAENERLKDELAEANRLAENSEAIKAENEWLRNFVIFTTENPNYKLTDALTVSRDKGDFVTYFTINKGSSSGIENGMPVMSDRGLVGYVCEVGLSHAKVRSIISDDTAAGAYCPRSAVYGTLEGSYAFLANGLCSFVCPDGDADLEVGDLIVTSGTGSVYPYGLPIGRVKSIDRNEYTRELVAYIEPYHDFRVADRVMIIASAPSTEADK